MNVEQLTEHARNFLKENYGMSLDIPIVVNNRLKQTLGSFVSIKGKPQEIEIAGFLIKYGAEEVVYDTLRHELIHYALCTQGRQYYDGNVEFESELRKHGVGSTETIFVGKVYGYKCEKCSREYESSKKSVMTTPERYKTRCCKSNIIPQEEIVYNGLEESR